MATTMTKTRTKTTDQINDTYQVSKEMNVALAAASSVIGLWVAACFIGAMVVSGGPFGLIRNYFQAVTGM